MSNKIANTYSNRKVAFICILVLAVFAVILLFPGSRDIFSFLSAKYPLPMGFIKFFFLATTGEVIALRLQKRAWICPAKLLQRAVIWGIIGMVLAVMLQIFSQGVSAVLASALVPGVPATVLTAFLTSTAMNVTFGPVMMGFHKMTDKYLELSIAGRKDLNVRTVCREMDWENFVMFVLFKTIPIFWIPAHTITFLLPPEYRTIMAAALSVALGLILGIHKNHSAGAAA